MPEINFNFFAEGGDEDLTELLDAAKTFRKAINAVGAPITPFNERHPCPGVNQNCTDEAQKEFIKLQSCKWILPPIAKQLLYSSHLERRQLTQNRFSPCYKHLRDR